MAGLLRLNLGVKEPLCSREARKRKEVWYDISLIGQVQQKSH